MTRERFDPLLAEWASFAGSPNFNLVEKCLKLAQVLEYPGLDMDGYVRKISRIGRQLGESVGGEKSPAYRISALNEHLFGSMGFAGDAEDYYNPKNNYLNEVVDRRSGMPIALSVLYAEVAKSAGIGLEIVGFPGHVMVRHGGGMLLDPYNGGRPVGRGDLQGMLDESFGGRVEFEPRFLDVMGTGQVLARLARNLKNSYLHSYAYEKALRCADMALAVEPLSAEDIRDKGMLEGRLLNADVALEYLNRYLEINPNGEDVDLVLETIRGIRLKD